MIFGASLFVWNLVLHVCIRDVFSLCSCMEALLGFRGPRLSRERNRDEEGKNRLSASMGFLIAAPSNTIWLSNEPNQSNQRVVRNLKLVNFIAGFERN